MTIFNNQRLDTAVFKIDVDNMRRGWYSDKYFCNNVKLLEVLSKEEYVFEGKSDLVIPECFPIKTGDIEVEMQVFTRRRPFSIIVGVDEALAILRECTGYYDENEVFINTYDKLEVEAVHDGTFVHYDGNPLNVEPVLKIRGRYRDFAMLETTILGVIAEPTRIATNVYNTLVASRSKEILFFPARFAHYKMQALHGYAYSVATQVYNEKYGKKNCRFVSTAEQGTWWGGEGYGTIAHATICCFFGDTAESMMQFSRIISGDVARIALVDFHNNCVADTLEVMRRMYHKYLELLLQGDISEAKKYKLYAVRPDNSSNMRDNSIVPIGNKKMDMGVNPRLVWNLRKAIDEAYLAWNTLPKCKEIAKKWCEDIKIVATGGFNVEKITEFEELDVPVDIYGVGSSLLENSSADGTNNDFTGDIVSVKLTDGRWHHMAKVGRRVCYNPNLVRIY